MAAFTNLLVFRLPDVEQLAFYSLSTFLALTTTRSILKRVSSRVYHTVSVADAFADERREHQRPLALHVLLLVLCPAHSSIWPSRYVSLASNADVSMTGVLEIPLQMILDDITTGTIEIRDTEVSWLLLLITGSDYIIAYLTAFDSRVLYDARVDD